MICNLSCSDIISIVGLVINTVLSIWIVKTLQNNLANKRYLKDFLIAEVKELRADYRKFLDELHLGKLKPRKIIPWFKLMNIKVQDTMAIVSSKYKIDKDTLKNYQVELRNLVTEFEEFIANHKENKDVKLGDNSLEDLIKFKQNNDSKFISLIVRINEK